MIKYKITHYIKPKYILNVYEVGHDEDNINDRVFCQKIITMEWNTYAANTLFKSVAIVYFLMKSFVTVAENT